MPHQHKVKSGETIQDIAYKFGFKYWRNIWFAGENNALSTQRGNPPRLQEGDVVTIPDHDKVSYMEHHPHVKKRLHHLFTQSTPASCWQAAAKMMFFWKHHRATDASFANAAGPYLKKTSDFHFLHDGQLFFGKKLHMNGRALDDVNQLHRILGHHGPILVNEVTDDAMQGHAMVLTGYDIRKAQWYLLNPSPNMTLNLGAGGDVMKGDVGDASDATIITAEATESNMGAWSDIATTHFTANIYYW